VLLDRQLIAEFASISAKGTSNLTALIYREGACEATRVCLTDLPLCKANVAECLPRG